MNKAKLTAATVVIIGGLFNTAVCAQANLGYVTDSRGAVVKSPSNLCWRTNAWTPSMATAECDPDLVPKPAPKPVPKPAPKPEAKPAPAKPVPVTKPEAKPAPVQPLAPRAAVAPKVCDTSVTLTADESFAFGKAVLSSAAKARLDKDIIARLAGCARVDAISIEGHSDRLGSQQGNQTLSMQRAEAVKAYLLGTSAPAKVVSASGKGATAPVKACPDSGGRKQLIACLAPNRRVVVNIKGTGK